MLTYIRLTFKVKTRQMHVIFLLISSNSLTDLPKSTLQTLYDATDKIDKYPIRYPTSIYKHWKTWDDGGSLESDCPVALVFMFCLGKHKLIPVNCPGCVLLFGNRNAIGVWRLSHIFVSYACNIWNKNFINKLVCFV